MNIFQASVSFPIVLYVIRKQFVSRCQKSYSQFPIKFLFQKFFYALIKKQHEKLFP